MPYHNYTHMYCMIMDKMHIRIVNKKRKKERRKVTAA